MHLVNYTNPAFRDTTSRAVYPVGPQQVRLTLRDARPIKAARLLRADQALPFRQTDNVVEFAILNLVDDEVAALEV